MIGPDYARTMAAYNREMNRRVYGAASRLPDPVRRADGGLFWGSIHGTLCHILWADRIWLSRFGACEAPKGSLRESGRLVEDFEDLRTQREGVDRTILDWADRLEASDLEGDLTWFSGAVGREMVRPKVMIVVHLFNHQTHHRGQVHALITRADEATGDTDLPFVLPD